MQSLFTQFIIKILNSFQTGLLAHFNIFIFNPIHMNPLSASFNNLNKWKNYIKHNQAIIIQGPEYECLNQILHAPSISIHVNSNKPLILQNVDFIASDGSISLKARKIEVVNVCTFLGKDIQIYVDQLTYGSESKDTIEQLKHVIKPCIVGSTVKYLYLEPT